MKTAKRPRRLRIPPSWEDPKWAGWNIPLWIRAEWCPQNGSTASYYCPVCVGIRERGENANYA